MLSGSPVLHHMKQTINGTSLSCLFSSLLILLWEDWHTPSIWRMMVLLSTIWQQTFKQENRKKKLLLDEHNRLHGSTWLSKLPSYFHWVNLNSPFTTSNSSGGPVPSKYHIQQTSLKDSFWTWYDCRNTTQEKHHKVTKKTILVSVPATPKKKQKKKQERVCCASQNLVSLTK